MKVWVLRVVVFVLIAAGGAALTMFVTSRVLEIGPLAEHWSEHRARELRTTGTMLAAWAASDRADKIRSFLGDTAATGVRYYLFDAGGLCVAGDTPTRGVLERARLLDATTTFSADPFPPPPDRAHTHTEAVSFTGLDGRPYALAVHLMPRAMPGPPPMKWALLAQCTGLVLAVLVLALLVRMTDGPAREVRQAIRRLSRGDLDVRLDAAMERRGDALARVAGEFNAMVESLANRHREQHLLFGEISHEMRTPLSRLALAAEMARGGGDERSIRLLELVRRDTERLDGLARQMLALARMEHHAGERAPVDLGVLLEELAETCSFEAAGHGRAVVVERDAGCGACMVLGDREQLSSMVENVLRNGVRHTPRGSCVHVRLEEQEHAGRPMAVVHVRDSGAGVPEEELARIFEPFYRGSACAGNDDDPAVGPGAGTGDPGGPTGGAGLGLAIARHVAVAHAGRISARNVPQGGLEVVIRLPLASAASDDDDVAGRRAAEPDPTDSGAPSGPASRPQKPHQDPPHSPARCRAADLLRTAHGRRFKATA